MAKTRRNRKTHRKRRSLKGGGPGAAYSVSGVLVPGMPYLVNNPISNCQATAPDYALRSVPERGLPGFSGGGEQPALSDMKTGGRRRKMRGGVYAVDPVSVGGDNTPNIAATFDRIACAAGAPPHVSPTVPTQPGYDMLPGAAPSALRGAPEPATITTAGFQKGGSELNLKGGALQPPYSGSPVLQETTAGYTHLRNGGDVFVTQGGVAEMINVPSGGRLGVPDACVRTHGGSRRRRSRRTQRRNRKNRNRK